MDLYAIEFDPILRPRDNPSWLTETIPDDMLDRMRLRESLLDEAGGPLKRFALKRLIGDRDARGIIRLLRERYQVKDVLAQQQKVARAEALAFVAPVHFLSFPAMLKGWLDRVWTPGFAYDLTPEAWRGDINGRQPKLTHKKALIIQTTIFDKRAYDAGLREAMRMVIDQFTLTYPGIKNVEHEYFYAVHGADDATRRGYLERAMPWIASSESSSKSGGMRWPTRVQRSQLRCPPPTGPLNIMGDARRVSTSRECVEPAQDGPLRTHCHADTHRQLDVRHSRRDEVGIRPPVRPFRRAGPPLRSGGACATRCDEASGRGVGRRRVTQYIEGDRPAWPSTHSARGTES